MSETAIKFENISKQYRLGLVGTGTVKDDINRWWHMVRGKEDPYLKIGEANDRSTMATGKYVWALKDISFDVKQGEVMGIIGKNGAGKSTLLKILSRVTSPSTGCIKAKGRIASLLEVGTGFHPELTGRENIYMNGSIMGMTKSEITRKLDEIIAFAGIEKYVDTPSKRYSSGMTVRLGFAIAAHLEPEILVVDEVLAVGDAEFQKKAIGKMQDVSKGKGRTVLFVSHNMGAVKSLCSRGIVLKNGRVDAIGDIDSIVDKYLRDTPTAASYEYVNDGIDKPNGYFKNIKLYNKNGEPDDVFSIDDEPYLEVEYIIKQNTRNYNTGLNLYNSLGVHVYATADTDLMDDISGEKKAGTYKTRVPLPLFNLNSGIYKIDLLMGIMNIQLFDQVEIYFTIDNKNYINTGNRPGLLLTSNKWEY
ncbi:MAG: ABC transporter ATP-binding protein [Prevotella sp.]|jgi:lipopolysaccharide transport system ATP-binding protein|nr:ABC transporter ATP-binding protein [Prevotella sp.]